MKKISNKIIIGFAVIIFTALIGYLGFAEARPISSSIDGPDVLTVGDSAQYTLNLEFKPYALQPQINRYKNNMSTIWFTSDESIATATDDGLFTANAAGQVVLQGCTADQDVGYTKIIEIKPKVMIEPVISTTIGYPIVFDIAFDDGVEKRNVTAPYNDFTFIVKDVGIIQYSDDNSSVMAAYVGETEAVVLYEGVATPVEIKIGDVAPSEDTINNESANAAYKKIQFVTPELWEELKANGFVEMEEEESIIDRYFPMFSES